MNHHREAYQKCGEPEVFTHVNHEKVASIVGLGGIVLDDLPEHRAPIYRETARTTQVTAKLIIGSLQCDSKDNILEYVGNL